MHKISNVMYKHSNVMYAPSW